MNEGKKERFLRHTLSWWKMAEQEQVLQMSMMTRKLRDGWMRSSERKQGRRRRDCVSRSSKKRRED